MGVAPTIQQGTPVNPADYLSIRSKGKQAGHGAFHVSVTPDKIRVLAESLLVLTIDDKTSRGKSQAIIEAVVTAAKLKLAANPELVLKIHDDIGVLLSELGIDGE